LFDVTPSALTEAVPPIPSHAYAALGAAGVGAVQLAAPKGTRRHRVMGWLFVLLMVYVAVSAVLISSIGTWGYFSPIHLLIPVTLVGLVQGVRLARKGDVGAHRRVMLQLFVLALFVTGLFTLWPGRIMHAVLFGPGGAG
jgi:uncharacterized membrane protein